MRTIAVIGLTDLGVTLARLLAATNRVDRLVFLDQDDQIAVGLAADLAASPAPHCEVVIQDPAALKAADVLVVTIGQRFLGQPDTFAQLAGNAQAIQEWRSAVTESGFSGVVLNLATPNEALTGLIQQEWQLPVQRVLGTGTITDTARLHQVVAAAVEQPASSVTGYMLGQHDGNLVPIWSSVRVNGRSIEEPINGHSLDTAKLLVDVREEEYRVLTTVDKGGYTLCSWTLAILDVLLQNGSTVLPVAVYQPQYQCYMSFPAQITRAGVGQFWLPRLYPVEEAQLKVAATAIKTQLTAMQG